MEFAGQKLTSKAGDDGKWTVNFKDLKMSFCFNYLAKAWISWIDQNRRLLDLVVIRKNLALAAPRSLLLAPKTAGLLL